MRCTARGYLPKAILIIKEFRNISSERIKTRFVFDTDTKLLVRVRKYPQVPTERLMKVHYFDFRVVEAYNRPNPVSIAINYGTIYLIFSQVYTGFLRIFNIMANEAGSKRCISCGLIKELEQFPVVYRREVGEYTKEIRSAICESCRNTDKSQRAIFLFNKFEIEEEDGRTQLLDIDYLDHLINELNKEKKIQKREQEAKDWQSELIEAERKALEEQNEKKDTTKEAKQDKSFLSKRNILANAALIQAGQEKPENTQPVQVKTEQDHARRKPSSLFHEKVKAEVVHDAMRHFFNKETPSNKTTAANNVPPTHEETLKAQDPTHAQPEQKKPVEKSPAQQAETSPWSPNANPNNPAVTELKNKQFIGSVTMAKIASDKIKASTHQDPLPTKQERKAEKRPSTETVIRNTWRKR